MATLRILPSERQTDHNLQFCAELATSVHAISSEPSKTAQKKEEGCDQRRYLIPRVVDNPVVCVQYCTTQAFFWHCRW